MAADAALLLTAAMIAWRTPDALTGGALLAVTVCVVAGAVLAVLPFVLNDAREREAALAERQRELVELVNTASANTSRWGTQWASAATGLEDAAQLASRSIAAAERLPEVFQTKADALAARLAAVESEALARIEKTASVEAGRAGQAQAVLAELQRTLGEFGRVEAGLKEQRAAIAMVLAEAPAAARQVHAAREELDARVAEVPALVEARTAQIERIAGEAEARLGATAEALAKRLTETEALIGEALAKLEQVAERAANVPCVEPAAAPQETPAPTVAVAPAPVVQEEAPAPVQAAEEKPKAVVNSATIMDPFLIPDDGYANLAEAMDAR